MKKLKKFVASPAVTMASLVLAIGLLLFSTIGGARAALTYYSDNYVSDVQLQQIEVALLENGKVVANNAAVARAGSALLSEMGEFHLGQTYQEQLAVQNPASSGDTENITQYVRVTVQKRWTVQDAQGKTVTNTKLDPELIELPLLIGPQADNKGGNGGWWLEDTSAQTRERNVLYYNRPLAPGEVSALFAETLTINSKAALLVDKTTQTEKTEKGDKTTVTTTYVYDKASFEIVVTVDAVQQHNAEAAIASAWGCQVRIAEDGTLTLVQ